MCIRAHSPFNFATAALSVEGLHARETLNGYQMQSKCQQMHATVQQMLTLTRRMTCAFMRILNWFLRACGVLLVCVQVYLRAGHTRAFMCICITFMHQRASTYIPRAFVCIHVHPRAFYVCIPVHLCASTSSTCICILCAFTRIACAFLHIYMHLHQTLNAGVCISCAPLCALVCIDVHYFASLCILVRSCGFYSACHLCAFMRIFVHQQCI